MPSIEAINTTQLKAGHPPAVKISGGVRIIQNKDGYKSPKTRVKRKEGEELIHEGIFKTSPIDFSSSLVRIDKAFNIKKNIRAKRTQQTSSQSFRLINRVRALQQPIKF